MKVLVVGSSNNGREAAKQKRNFPLLLPAALDAIGCTALLTFSKGWIVKCAERWLRDHPEVAHIRLKMPYAPTEVHLGGARPAKPVEILAWEIAVQHKCDLAMAFWPGKWQMRLLAEMSRLGVKCVQTGVAMEWSSR